MKQVLLILFLILAIMIVQESKAGKNPPPVNIQSCINDVESVYADTCGEMDTDGPDAHYDGFVCGLEAVKLNCIETPNSNGFHP